MSLLGKAVGVFTLGLVREVDEAEERPPVAEEGVHAGAAQAAPTSARLTTAASAAPPSASASEIAAAAAKRAGKDLEAVLAATPDRFQQFLLKRQEFVEALQDAGADPNKIEGVATAKAIKALRLTIADVTDAAGAAKQALDGIRAEFAATVQGTEQERVARPTAEIAATAACRRCASGWLVHPWRRRSMRWKPAMPTPAVPSSASSSGSDQDSKEVYTARGRTISLPGHFL